MEFFQYDMYASQKKSTCLLKFVSFSKVVFSVTKCWLKFLVFRLRSGLGFMAFETFSVFFNSECVKADQYPKLMRLSLRYVF